jgi:hypothetical protein
MPPKRKDSAATPVPSGPKPKRSRTSFRTPTTAGLEDTAAQASEVGSTKNRVVTLRASASGRRGYRSQDMSTAPSSTSTLNSPAADDLALPSSDLDIYDPILPPDQESDAPPGPSAKSRPKQKNTTTVR